MGDTDVKRIVIFQSTVYDTSLPEGAEPDAALPSGRCVGEYLMAELAKRDADVECLGPFEDEDHWAVAIEYAGRSFWLIIHFVPLGEPGVEPEDYWVVQVVPRRTLLDRLARRCVVSRELRQLCQFVGEAVEQVSDVHEPVWLSESEFRKLY
ncbi:hypothetical protein D6833_05225 [Candidatus Parcubacteria bacterium]|nr:MAG: hypothetical protein D6833_05225 [Candidatus Parcubacteria bacterium]